MRARAGSRTRRLGWCAALAFLRVGIVEAAPPRGYDGPGAIESSGDAEVEIAAPTRREGEEDPTASDEPGDAGPPATDAGGGLSTKSPPDLERAAEGTPPAPPAWLPRHRIVYRNLLAGRIGPRGLVDELTVGYRLQIVKRDTLLFRDTFMLLGAHAFVTPAFTRVGPTIEIQPAAVLNLAATYDFVGTYGAFGQTRSFPTPTVPYGPDDLRAVPLSERAYPAIGQLATLSALLQGKVRNVAFRNQVKFYWQAYRLHAGDTVFVDAALDILAPNRGWTMTNDSDLIWLFTQAPVALVVRHTFTKAFYRQRDFLRGEPVSDPNGPTLRLGPGVSWTIFDYRGARFNRPTLFVLSQWWLKHRYRTGAQTHPAVPYLVFGFSFEGDFLKPRKRPASDPRLIKRRR